MAGIVVEDIETGIRYARSERNFNPAKHRKIRDLLPGESILSDVAKSKDSSSSENLESNDTENIGSVPSSEDSQEMTPEGY